MTTQPGGRITCPRCGANNFDTVAECWKCQAPLAGPASAVRPATMAGPIMLERPMPIYGPPVSPNSSGDPGSARRAAIALALTLPFIGLPVGWIFMMIEDERKQAVGRICATWSMIALLLQLLLMFAFAQSLGPWLNTLVATASKAAQSPQLPGGTGGP